MGLEINYFNVFLGLSTNPNYHVNWDVLKRIVHPKMEIMSSFNSLSSHSKVGNQTVAGCQ